jgi:hypothetical protein
MSRHTTASIAAEWPCGWVPGAARHGGTTDPLLSWADSGAQPGDLAGPALHVQGVAR